MTRLVLFLGLLLTAGPSHGKQAPRVGEPFPLIALPLIGGDEGTLVSIERYRGRKLMLHFFASW